MKRVILTAAVLVSLLFVTATAVAAQTAAIQTTVKMAAQMYNPNGQVVATAQVGQAFFAQGVRGNWVWGVLQTGQGQQIQGWIALEATDLSPENYRRLPGGTESTSGDTTDGSTSGEITSDTETTDAASESVLLRYNLGLSELQVYEVEQEIASEFDMGSGYTGNISQKVRLRYSLQGRGATPDGQTRTQLRFHDVIYESDTSVGPHTIHIQGDNSGATLEANGKQEYKGPWGSRKLAATPNYGALLKTPYGLIFSPRGEASLDAMTEKLTAIALEDALGCQCVFPEGAVAVDTSWTQNIARQFVNPADPKNPATLIGTATFTVLERTTHRNRRCVKLGLVVEMKTSEDSTGIQFTGTTTGTIFVDEATGIRLDTSIESTLTMQGTVGGMQIGSNGTGKITVTFIGNQL